MKASINVVVIGLGHQSLEDHLPAVLEIPSLRLVGVSDLDIKIAKKVGQKYKVPFARSAATLLKKVDKPDVAIVAVPHSEYIGIIKELAAKKIHIIKEKPFARTIEEANQFIAISKNSGISIQVTMQRRFNPIFIHFCQLVKRVGSIYSIEARYTMNIADLSKGWRSNSVVAGGGVIIDMGYHYLDLFIWYFGLPDKVRCRVSTQNRIDQKYDVEDTAFIDMTYVVGGKEILASLIVSRAYPKKEEGLTAYGSRGSVSVRRGKLSRFDLEGEVVEELRRLGGWPSAIVDQLEEFVVNIHSRREKSIKKLYGSHIALLAACYDSAQLGREVRTRDYSERISDG